MIVDCIHNPSPAQLRRVHQNKEKEEEEKINWGRNHQSRQEEEPGRDRAKETRIEIDRGRMEKEGEKEKEEEEKSNWRKRYPVLPTLDPTVGSLTGNLSLGWGDIYTFSGRKFEYKFWPFKIYKGMVMIYIDWILLNRKICICIGCILFYSYCGGGGG